MADSKELGTDSMADAGELEKSANYQELQKESEETSPTRVGPIGHLERYINFASAINFGILLLCSWEAVAVTFQFSLTNGGPASMFYGCIFSGIGSTIVAACLAEMASIDPTVGAQYRWTATFAPRGKKFWGLLQGWITVFAWMCTCASALAVLSNIVVALLIFNKENYNPQRWHATLLIWAFTLVLIIGNFWFRKLINILQTVGAICHVLFFIASIITLLVLAKRSTTEYVFRTLTHEAPGWTNPGAAWGIGLLTVTYSVAGFDGVLHMSDEVKKVRERVPRSIISSCGLNSIIQFVYILVLLFTMGDVDKVVNTPTGLPIIEVYYQATGSKAATNVFVVMVAIVMFIGPFNIFASVSRLTWAFARDNGLPFSKFFAYVHPTLKMPMNSLGLVGLFTFLIAIIYIGSSTAFNAVVSLTAIALYVSYFPPIFFFFLARLSKNPPQYGPFTLGKLGIPLNLYALCYIIYITIWLPFPTVLPVTAVNMNYAGPLLGAIIVAALLDWCISGRKRFDIPIARTVPDFS